SSARSREIAVRGSLGASRWRIARQLLTESMITGAAGAVLGTALSYGLLFAVKAIIPPNTIPDESDVSLNASVLTFAVMISLLTSMLAGVSPAFHACRLDLVASLKSAGRGFASSIREKRLRKILVSAEMSLAMMLLVAAGLVGRTLWNLQDLRL